MTFEISLAAELIEMRINRLIQDIKWGEVLFPKVLIHASDDTASQICLIIIKV